MKKKTKKKQQLKVEWLLYKLYLCVDFLQNVQDPFHYVFTLKSRSYSLVLKVLDSSQSLSQF